MKNRFVEQIISGLLAAGLILGLVACDSKESMMVVNPNASSVAVAVATAEPTPRPPYPNGFKLPKKGSRPVAVMIDNQGDRPLPQGGLHKADVVYEALAEGGITRYMAVFWDQLPEKIGPVRSSRHYFVDFAMEHDAIYVHIGWSPQAQAEISRYGASNINGLYDSIFHKITSDPYNWQDKYTSGKKILNYAKDCKKYSLKTKKDQVFSYLEDVTVPQKGKRVDSLYISYNAGHNCKYVYDAKKQYYYRWRMGKKHMERESGKQISAGNIIIQYCSNSSIINDAKNRQELKNIGSGTGWFVTMGKAQKITWSKKSATAPTIYKYASNGKKIKLNPAQTWVQVTPPSAKVEFKAKKVAKIL